MPNALNYLVGPDYLKAMGIPLLRRRFFTPQDNIHSRFVAVIDERFERQYFPNRNPIGEHVHLSGLDDLFEIVGVVGHVNQRGLDENEESAGIQLYTSIDQIPDKFSRRWRNPLVSSFARKLSTAGLPVQFVTPSGK
jgi:hypothetical protein